MTASGRKQTFKVVQIVAAEKSASEWLLYAGDLNRSTQHLHSSTQEGDVENEAAT